MIKCFWCFHIVGNITYYISFVTLWACAVLALHPRGVTSPSPCHPVRAFMSQISIEIDSSEGIISEPSTQNSSSSSEEDPSSDSDWWRGDWQTEKEGRKMKPNSKKISYWTDAQMAPLDCAKRTLSSRKEKWSAWRNEAQGAELKESQVSSSNAWLSDTDAQEDPGRSYQYVLGEMHRKSM